jgi:hypothetical protein
VASHAATVLTHSPVLFLRLGEASGTTAADSSGSGNAGTYSGTYALGQDDPLIGDGNTAVFLSENSPGGQVSVPHNAAFNLTTATTDRWSIEFMFATPSGAQPADTFPRLLSKGTSGQTGWGLFIGVNGQALTMKLAGASFSLAPGQIAFAPTFTHVVVVFNGATMQAYLNGVAQSAVTTAAVSSTSTSPLLINQENGAHFGNFTYDEVAVYKSALTSADVTALYGSLGNGTGGSGPTLSGSLSTSGGGSLSLSGVGATATSLRLTATAQLDLDGTAFVGPVPSGEFASSALGTLDLSGSGTWPQLSMVATPEPDYSPPRVRIDITDTRTVPVTSLTITRQDADGRSYPVRTSDGGPLAVSGGVATVWDYEVPFGTTVTYSTDVTGGPTVDTILDPPDVWLVHPGVPSLSVPLLVTTLPTRTRSTGRTLYQILGREDPIPVSSGARATAAAAMGVRTVTEAQRQALDLLCDDDAVLLLNIPPAKRWGWASCYISIGDITETRTVNYGRFPYREWQLPIQEVARPGGGTQAAITWNTVAAQYATWQDIVDAGITSWAELAAPTT